MEHLLFTVTGPMASWGGPAPGTQRPTEAHPTKSAILGLVAACLGVRHEEEDRFLELDRSLGYAVRTDHPGVLLRDYHTAQSPERERQVVHRTRRSELRRDPLALQTILSSRDYRCDAHWTVCLWPTQEADEDLLDSLVRTLERPLFTPYLGRKSCPASKPFWPKRIKATTLREAFEQYAIPLPGDVPVESPVSLHWEPMHPSPGIKAESSSAPRDRVLSHTRRTFRSREELVARQDLPRIPVEVV